MIDRTARTLLAENLRHFVNALSTNDDFEAAVLDNDTDDPGYWAVVDQAWCLYSDNRSYRLTGAYALTTCERRVVSRIMGHNRVASCSGVYQHLTSVIEHLALISFSP